MPDEKNLISSLSLAMAKLHQNFHTTKKNPHFFQKNALLHKNTQKRLASYKRQPFP
jgi:hypothetical protein